MHFFNIYYSLSFQDKTLLEHKLLTILPRSNKEAATYCRWRSGGLSVTITQVIRGLWGSRGAPQWIPHFSAASCSVTVPNETPWSCGSAPLICGSGLLLGERAATATTAWPLQLPATLLVPYWLSSCTAMFLYIRSWGFRLKCWNDLSFLWSPVPDSTGWMKDSVK